MRIKRLSVLIILLVFLPIVSAEDRIETRSYVIPNECPGGHRMYQYFGGYYSFSNRTFDNATLTDLTYSISTTQNGTVTILAVQEGPGYNQSLYPIGTFSIGAGESITLDASDFGLSDWSGTSECHTWQSYYNLTHYQLVTYSFVKLPAFIIEFENTVSDLAIVVSEISMNVTFSNFRDLESVFIPKNSSVLIPGPAEPIYHWWGDYFPGTGNILIDALFQHWINDQDYDETEWYAFFYDPTQFFPRLFEWGIMFGFMGGIIFAVISAWFMSRRYG